MFRKLLQTLSVFVILFILTPVSYTIDYLHQVFDLKEGLPQSQVNCIVQDQRGYLWIGTQYGLSRFNGYDFRNYYGKDGLPSPIVTSLKVDSKGLLWIGTSNGIVSYDGIHFINYGLSSNKILDVQDIFINSKDEVYYVSSGEWGVIKGGKAVEITADFETQQLSCITGDNYDNFFLAGRSNIVFKVNHGRIEKIRIKDSSLHITSLIWDKYRSRLWIGTDGGLFYMANGELTAVKTTLFDPQHNLTSIIVPDKDNLFVGVYGMGIYALNNNSFVPTFTGQGMLINSLYMDSSKNIWLGYDGKGLGRLSASPFENISTDSGTIRGYVMSIFQDRNKEIWCSTISNGLYRFKNKNDRRPENFRFGDNTAINSIRSIIQDSDGSYWLGSMMGIIHWNKKTFRVYKTEDGITHQVIRNIYQDDAGTIWFSTDDRITLYSNGKFSPFAHNSKFSHPMVRQVIQDSYGNYWIATLGGLYVYDGKELVQYTKNEALSKLGIETLMSDSAGNLWIGGVDSLLLLNNNGTVKRFGVEDGFESSTIYFLLEGNDGVIWVGTGTGLQYYVDGRFYLYDSQNGLVGNECNSRACLKDNEGNLWFGLLEGISIYFNGKSFGRNIYPPVYFDEVLIDGSSVDLQKQISVPYTVKNYIFKYHSVNLNPGTRVKYRVRLHPIEMDWSKPTSERNKTYSYLKPGKYSFQITTYLESKPDRDTISEIRFVITPPVWSRWWFILTVSLVVASSIAVMISMRIHRLQREREQLREAIKDRTQELQEKNRELESFAYTVSHDLKDPVGVIVGYTQVLEDFLKKQNIQGTNQFTEGIKRNSDRIIRFIDDMLQLSRSGKIIEKPVPTDTKIIVSQIANDIKQKRKLKNSFITMNNLPVVMADADRLYMVFRNLIDNAYKYRDKKRSIKINVSYKPEGDYHKFSVKDNGIGIKEEDFKKIFQPGVRLKVVDTTGTGFGLRIVKKIVEAHGGRIWVESKSGSGSTFHFTLRNIHITQ